MSKGCTTILRNSLSLLSAITMLGMLFMANAFLPHVWAQSTYGSIVGTLLDSSGKIIPGAEVILTATETNVRRTTLTHDNGFFEFPNLVPGRYHIEVTVAGFNPVTTPDFTLEARAVVRQDVQLSLAGVSTSITVTAPQVNADNPTVANAVNSKELQELPYSYRTENTSVLPAIRILSEVQFGTGEDQFSLSGGMAYQNDISVDGIMTTSVRDNGVSSGEGGRSGGGYNVFPSMEGIREVRVSSVSNNAEFAQMGDLTTITRSGTNQVHGSAFWNYNGSVLNANANYFATGFSQKRRVNNDFGGSMGGPVYIPHIYNGKDKTFFFADYERLTIYSSQLTGSTVPTLDERQGLVSSTTPLINPYTGQAYPTNGAGKYIIPINSASRKILDNYIPAPTQEGNRHYFAFPASTESNQFDVRIDHNFSAGHSLFGRWSWKNTKDSFPDTFPVTSPLAKVTRSRNLVISDTYSLRSNLLNEFRFGITRSDFDRNSFTTLKGAAVLADWGLNPYVKNIPDVTGTPYLRISGYSNFGVSQPETPIQRNWQFGDNVTYTSGSHTFKGGFDGRRLRWAAEGNFTGADDFGVFSFTSGAAGGTSSAIANFLLGIPTSSDQTASGPPINANTWHYGVFFQDDWRVARNITVNMGLRYDFFKPFHDVAGNITNFLRDTANGDVVVPDAASLALTKPAFSQGIGTAKIFTADQVGLPTSLRRPDKNNFAPRFGIAWRPFSSDKLVLRGGYGIYYVRILGAIFNSLSQIHTSDNVTFVNTFDTATRTIGMVWPDTATGQAKSVASAAGSQNFSTANDPNYRDPYTQQWSFTVEQQLSPNHSLRVSYIGHHTVKLTLAPDLNQIQPNTIGYNNMFMTTSDGTAVVIKPTLGIADPRPFRNWRRINTRDNGGSANYNDITVQFKGLIKHWGLNYTTSYKFAKAISDVEQFGSGTGNFTNEISGRTDNRFNPRFQRGPMQALPNQRFANNLVWDVPIGRSRAFGAGMNRVLDAVIGGWTVSNITTLQTGQHLSATYSGYCGSGTYCYSQEPADVVNGQDPNAGPKTVRQWFNTGAFSTANLKIISVTGDPTHPGGIYPGRFGNAGKGTITGPGLIAVDAAFYKDIRFNERVNLRFQSQISNLLNHPNFGNPITDLNNANYGKIQTLLTSGDYGPRRILLGLRLTF